jgi:hypothetical protein
MAESLSEWWVNHAHQEADRTISKMEEYGAGDLAMIGYSISRIANRKVRDEKQAAELGIVFYAIGKIARVITAVEEGRTPSDDTWFDLAVYAKMVLAIRGDAWTIGSRPDTPEARFWRDVSGTEDDPTS